MREVWAGVRCSRISRENDVERGKRGMPLRLWLDVDMVTECWHRSRRSAVCLEQREIRLIPGSEG